MIFDLNNARVMRAVKREKFPLFRYAKFFENLFLFLFILALLVFVSSFFNIASGHSSVKLAALFLALYIIFWNFSLFVELKIKRPEPATNLAEAAASPDNFNLADYLSFEAAKIVADTIKFCRKKRLPISSAALFYAAVRNSGEIAFICFRLGLDAGALKNSLKNYLEKMRRRSDEAGNFSADFQKTIIEALKFAQKRRHGAMGEKELLVALARSDDFFKKLLIERDLKEIDIENLAIWLDTAEGLAREAKQFWSKENLARQGSLGKDWASGYTITLDKFSVDWRRVVSRWTYREIVGHQKEIEQVEMVLAKTALANALIVGERGTGRKSIVEALAQKCYLGTSLPELNGKRVVELDLVALAAQVQDPEKLEAMLDQIFSEAVASGNVILAIDELHNFVGLKENKPGKVDISGIISKYLAMPSFKFVAITDFSGLHKNIEAVSSFTDFFRKVEVSEISENETIQILQSAALELEHRNNVLILYPSIREIVNLTARYMPSLPFPKKALDVLDEAVVYVRSRREKNIPVGRQIVRPGHIAKIVSSKTDIPVGKMETKEKETLLNLESLIHERLVNQAEAVAEISIAMRRARAGIGPKKRPMGSFLFLGPTGVGKTETAKALAQIYFGGEDKMIRLDMSEFQAIADIPRLIGAASPAEIQGILTTSVREKPFSLLLLDEIEKAHPNILNLFLQVLDEGHITDGQGRKVVFANTIIIFTSNAAADMIFGAVESGEKLDKQKIISSLIEKGVFKPEFINRFDAAVLFHPLSRENLMEISRLTLHGLQKNLKEKEIDFEITEHLKEEIVRLSYKPEFGAREMRRVIQDKVENTIAQALLSDKIKKGDKIQINPETFELIVNPVS